MPRTIELVIKLVQDIMPLSIVTKFHEDEIVWLKALTSLIWQTLDNSWLSNLSEISCLYAPSPISFAGSTKNKSTFLNDDFIGDIKQLY